MLDQVILECNLVQVLQVWRLLLHNTVKERLEVHQAVHRSDNSRCQHQLQCLSQDSRVECPVVLADPGLAWHLLACLVCQWVALLGQAWAALWVVSLCQVSLCKGRACQRRGRCREDKGAWVGSLWEDNSTA